VKALVFDWETDSLSFLEHEFYEEIKTERRFARSQMPGLRR
jgi:hypothetical protein